MSNGLTRCKQVPRRPRRAGRAEKSAGDARAAEDAEALGLVTFAPDDIDWDEEVASRSRSGQLQPDALTGLEANYRSPAPRTLETKIFGRLTAWQNWISPPERLGPRRRAAQIRHRAAR